jgi:hypothetical protein
VAIACQLLRYASDILMTDAPDTTRDEIIDKIKLNTPLQLQL